MARRLRSQKQVHATMDEAWRIATNIARLSSFLVAQMLHG
jgi:hypothetical protein